MSRIYQEMKTEKYKTLPIKLCLGLVLAIVSSSATSQETKQKITPHQLAAEIQIKMREAQKIEDPHTAAENFVLLSQRILTQDLGPHRDFLLNRLIADVAFGIKSAEERSYVYQGIAYFMIQQNLPENWLAIFEKLLNETLKIKETSIASQTLAKMIWPLPTFKLQEKALPWFDSILVLLTKQPQRFEAGTVLSPMIQALGPLWEEGIALDYILKLFKTIEGLAKDPHQGELLGLMAYQLVDAWLGDQRDAFFEEALRIAESIGNPYSKAQALCFIASAWSYRAPFEKVKKIFDEALSVAEGIQTGSQQSEALSLVAYQQWSKLKENQKNLVQLFEQVIFATQEIKIKEEQALTHDRLIKLLRTMGLVDSLSPAAQMALVTLKADQEKLATFDKQIVEAQGIEDIQPRVAALLKLSTELEKENFLERKEKILAEAIAQEKMILFAPFEKIKVLVTIGLYFREVGETKKANEWLQKANQGTLQIKNPKWRGEILKAIREGRLPEKEVEPAKDDSKT